MRETLGERAIGDAPIVAAAMAGATSQEVLTLGDWMAANGTALSLGLGVLALVSNWVIAVRRDQWEKKRWLREESKKRSSVQLTPIESDEAA